MPDPHATDRSAPASPLPSAASEGEGRDERSDPLREIRRLIANAIEDSDSEPCAENDDVYMLNAYAVLDALGLEEVGSVDDDGRLHGGCNGGATQAHRDCVPVYRLGVSR